jgi:Protein of unknown function (DUF2971)
MRGRELLNRGLVASPADDTSFNGFVRGEIKQMIEATKSSPIDDCKAQLLRVAECASKESWAAMNSNSKKPISAIYHYTSAENALNILKSGELWFTERAHLNDPSEIKFGIELAEYVARSLASPIADWLRHLRERFMVPHAYYTASFSVDGDSLPQWRAYADDGKGIALGFSLGSFDKDDPAFKILENDPTTFPVRYDRNRLEYYRRKLIELAGEFFGNDDIQAELAFCVILNSLLFKHYAYEQRHLRGDIHRPDPPGGAD